MAHPAPARSLQKFRQDLTSGIFIKKFSGEAVSAAEPALRAHAGEQRYEILAIVITSYCGRSPKTPVILTEMHRSRPWERLFEPVDARWRFDDPGSGSACAAQLRSVLHRVCRRALDPSGADMAPPPTWFRRSLTCRT